MKINLPDAVKSRVGHQLLSVQQRSPKLLFGAGLVLMGATVVTACKGTLALNEVLYDIKNERDDVKLAVERDPDRFTDREVTKLNVFITVKGVLSITRLYLPALALGVASVACLTTSHSQLTRRNAGLSAALAATQRALDTYRDRVREAYGEDRERELYRGERTDNLPVLDDEGRETKSKTKVKLGGGYSPYARMWGRDTTNEWSPQPEYNLAKLRAVQTRCTMILNSRGHLFLNEVHDELGLERTPAGQVVGWLSTKYGGGDGYVDFGILKTGDEVQFVDFLTGDEDHIWLDFNVDGPVWKQI